MAKTDLPSQVKRSEALKRLLMLAALMLSLMGGLWVMSGSAPLAAQTGASATRSFSSDSVTPGATMTVTIASAGYGAFGSVTETLPAGFTYVSQSGAFGVVQDGQQVTFTLLGANQTVSYDVTASSTDGTYSFGGTLRDDDTNDHTVGGSTDVTVSTDSAVRRRLRAQSTLATTSSMSCRRRRSRARLCPVWAIPSTAIP